MLCTEVLNGLTSAMKVIRFVPGKEFEVVTLSIDPRETPQLAANKKEMYLKKLGNPEAAEGWHFLTGEQAQIAALANAVGWHYRYDPKLDQFAHAAGNHADYAGGQDCAVLLRRGVFGEGHAAGHCGGFAEQDWVTGRPGAAVLLSLRSAHGTVRGDDHQHHPAGRAHHGDCAGRRSATAVSSQRSTIKASEQDGHKSICGPICHLFPARASTMAGHVDALYFFLVAMAAFFTCLIAALILYFCAALPQGTQSAGDADPRFDGAGAVVDRHPAGHRDDHLCVVVGNFLHADASAQGGDGNLLRGQAVDVEVPAHRKGSGRSTNCTFRRGAMCAW